MKKMLMLFLILAGMIYSAEGEQMKNSTGVVPVPKDVVIENGMFEHGGSLSVAFEGEFNKQENFEKKLLSAFQNKTITPQFNSSKNNIIVKVDEAFKPELAGTDFFADEAYSLNVTKNDVLISAGTEKGAFMGVITFIQLADNYGIDNIPVMTINDAPDLSVRAVSDDISRGQVSTMDNFKKIIDFMAYYKMNTYMPYMEDMLQLDSFPDIGKDRGALSKEEVKELVEYADANFIEVIPIYQTLGHYENILLQEKYMDYAEFPGAASLNVSNPATYDFLEKMLTEVFDLFPSKYFHMGADESFDVGLGKSKSLADSSSIAKIHADHYKKVYDICKAHGKTVLMYGDIILRHPEILDYLPKDIIIVDWHYRPQYDYPSTVTFSEAGHKYFVSPSVWNFQTTFPTYANAMPNTSYIVEDGIKHGASGVVSSNWGDYGAETIKELIYFGYAWASQCGWNETASNPAQFSRDFLRSFYGIDNDAAQNIYREFSYNLNHMIWHEVWRHPLLDFRARAWWQPSASFSETGQVNWIRWVADDMIKNIDLFEKTAGKNKDHTTLFRFFENLNLWFADKTENQFLLHDIMKGKSEDYKSATEQVNDLKERLIVLKDQYGEIWKTYYREDNLFMITDKFERLISYYSEIEKGLNNKLLVSPEISSDWIYAVSKEDGGANEAEFKREFYLSEIPSEAKAQLLGDTYAELYVNGEHVKTVFAKRSLSLIVDYERIKYFDLAPWLKEGKNVIEVKTKTYSPWGNSGFNFIARLKTGSDNIIIKTDSSWMAKKAGETLWQFAVKEEYPFTVIAPDFDTDRPSWIER